MIYYDPANHYWIVARDETQVWSSAAAGYVDVSDKTYAAWLALGNQPTRIVSEAELDEVLIAAGIGDRAPHPPKRTVMKSVIVSRLIDAGKIGAAYQALNGNPEYWARWVAPDRPAINHDDPDALKLLKAIGADPETILAP